MHNDNKLSALIDGVYAGIEDYKQKTEGVSKVVLYGMQYNALIELALQIKERGDLLAQELHTVHAPRQLVSDRSARLEPSAFGVEDHMPMPKMMKVA